MNELTCKKEMAVSSYEIRLIEFESARNGAMDAYFKARPHLLRAPTHEKIFEAGFRCAWDYERPTK